MAYAYYNVVQMAKCTWTSAMCMVVLSCFHMYISVLELLFANKTAIKIYHLHCGYTLLLTLTGT